MAMASAATACRGLSRCNRRQRISGSSSTPTVQFEECPCCGQRLRASKRAKRHLAFCAPDLLDGEEWAKRGIPAMESHLTRKYNDRHRARRAVEYRFGLMQAGQEKIIPASEISRKLDLPKQAVTKFIRREVADLGLLHNGPGDEGDDGLEVVYEDESLLAVNKQRNVKCSPSTRLSGDGVVNSAASQLGFEPYLCHRLDKITSGLLLLAKTKPSARHIQFLFEQRRVNKSYLALCCARSRQSSPSSFWVDLPIRTSPYRSRAQAWIDSKHGRQAQTWVEVLSASEGGLAVVRARPKQGRTHQVRLHLSTSGLPIKNDPLYGSGDGVMVLHCETLQFTHPEDGRAFCLHAPLPPSLSSFL